MTSCLVNSWAQRKHLFPKYRMQAFTPVFYFTIVLSKILIGINRCRIGTHLKDESALSISHTEDETTKPSYFSVKTVFFDRTKWMCFKSLSCDLKYFFFDFLSLPPFFPPSSPYPLYWCPLLSLPPSLKLICRKQTTNCMKTVLSALTVEREQTIQALFNHSILPEREKQGRHFVLN